MLLHIAKNEKEGEFHKMRPIILKLATKISLECGTYTGVTPNDPEYKILDPVLTDEMAEIAWACASATT